MRKLFLPAGLFFLFIFSISSCYYDNMQKLHPTLGLNVTDLCDTTNVTYSKSIVNILQTSCYVCHSTDKAATLGSGYILDTYNDLNSQITSGFFPQCLTGSGGLTAMPKNLNSLPACQLRVIDLWIAAGAPNN